MLKGWPCKVMDISCAKVLKNIENLIKFSFQAGKHGSAKASIIGIDIFTNKKHEDGCPSTHNIDVPVVSKKEFQLIDITDYGYTTLLLDNGIYIFYNKIKKVKLEKILNYQRIPKVQTQ